MVYIASAGTHFASAVLLFAVLLGMIDMHQHDGGWPWEWAWTWRIGLGVVLAFVAAGVLSQYAQRMAHYPGGSDEQTNACRNAGMLHIWLAFVTLVIWRTSDPMPPGAGTLMLMFLVCHVFCNASPIYVFVSKAMADGEKENEDSASAAEPEFGTAERVNDGGTVLTDGELFYAKMVGHDKEWEPPRSDEAADDPDPEA